MTQARSLDTFLRPGASNASFYGTSKGTSRYPTFFNHFRHFRRHAMPSPLTTKVRSRNTSFFVRFLLVIVSSLWVLGVNVPSVLAQSSSAYSMAVGTPTVDSNGVKSYPVSSIYQGSQQLIVRVLEPTTPVAGKRRRLLYVLPVVAGVTDLSSTFSDGLEELRLLDVPNRFNLTLIAPSFNYEPWYGDNVLDPTLWMESFVVKDLVPFGDTFAQGTQRFLIGLSKSGNGALTLILRNPNVFTAAAAWDAPAQLNDLSAFPGLPINFGTQANFDLYYIPSLVLSSAPAFQPQNRLWISGDQVVWTADMIQLHNQLTASSIPHTWVQGGVRAHSWGSGWLDGAVTALDAYPALMPPVRMNGQPTGTLPAGTSQTSLSLTTDESATCRYATTAGVAYGSMPNTFSSTGGTAHSTLVSGLVDGGSYSYYVRCQDGTGNANPDDFVITFSVASGTTGTSTFTGIEDPLSENGMWDTPGAWTSLKKNNGAYSTNSLSAARLATPVVAADQYAEITYDQDPGSSSWVGVTTRVQGRTNGSDYLAIAYAGQVRLYRTDDSGALNFTLLASASANLGAAPRRLRLESQAANHRIYFNGALALSYTENTYTTGQPGIAASVFGGPTVKILSFVGGALTGDTTPPVRTNGQPTGVLPAGTTQTNLSLTTDENATCRYATTAGVAYGSMPNTFSSTGGTAHSTLVSGLVDGGSYSYYVRCQDGTGNANPDDFVITFSVSVGVSSISVTPASVTGGTQATATVTLNGTAPSGGAAVNLASSDPAATVPSSITVAANAATATFTVSTNPVSTNTPVTLSATYNNSTRTTGLTVTPPQVTSVTFSPNSVVGGNSSTGTVTLNGPAPGGGALVTISSSNTSVATVPASVTVASGATTTTFTVTTSPVTTSTSVSISASYANSTSTGSLTITPAAATLSSVTLSPRSVRGGSSSTGTVTLNGPAPGGGALVTISSSNTSVATVPAIVTVASGATTATFSVTSAPVAADTSVAISATYGTITKAATLTVTAATLSSVTLSPTSVRGGSASTGTVTLNGPAPAGGALVTLGSSSAVATVPTSVAIAANATSSTFSVSTTPVAANTSVTISATYGTISRTATLTVTAATLSSVSLSPTSVLGGGSSTGTVNLNGPAPVGGALVTLRSNNTAAASVPASVTIAPNATTATFNVTTAPVAANTSVTISATYGTTAKTASLTVKAAGLSSLTLSPTSVQGGTQAIGTVTLSGPAPPLGATVSLTSSKTTVATVPSSVTVPANMLSATFAIATSPVTATKSVTISAKFGGTQRTTLTVTP